MSYTETTNYSLRKQVYGSESWHTDLNWTLDTIDTTMKTLSDAIVSENIWDRTGTTITPETAGDSLTMAGGTISCGTLTDGTLSSTAGTVTGGVSITSTTFTDGTATITGGDISTTGTLGSSTITMTNNSDTVTIDHDGTDAYMKWSDGKLYLKTDEGTNTRTNIYVEGKGTGGTLLALSEDGGNHAGFITVDSNGTMDVDYIGISEIVFNQDGADVDFRVESDGSTHCFFVDAGNNVIEHKAPTPSMRFYDTDCGDGDISGELRFLATNTGSGAEDVDFTIYSQLNGSLDNIFRFDASVPAIVANEDSRDIDFRVESNNNANMLFVDAGNDRVGIGTQTPAGELEAFSASNGPTIYAHTNSETAGHFTGMRLGVHTATAETNYKGALLFERDGAFGVGTLHLCNDGAADSGNAAISDAKISITGTEVSVNDVGADVDFRVEGDTNANLLFCDAGNDRVGIGTATPSALQHNASAPSFCAFLGENTAAGGEWVTLLAGASSSGTSFSDTGKYIIWSQPHANKGTLTGVVECVSVSESATVVNETGLDMDFRVESDTDANALFVNAGTDKVGVGTNSPADKFTVSAGNVAGITITSSNSGQMRMDTTAGGAGSRNWALATEYNAEGYFEILQSATEAGVPNVSRLKLATAEAAFNDAGEDVDLRVESDNCADFFKIDAGEDTITIDATGQSGSDLFTIISNDDTTLTMHALYGSERSQFIHFSHTNDSWNNYGSGIESYHSSADARIHYLKLYSSNQTNLNVNNIWIQPDKTVINDGGLDMDFRVEGSTDTDLFVIDAGDNTVNISDTTAVNAILDEDDMASDSATALATQQSIKAYVDAQAGGGDTIPPGTITMYGGSSAPSGWVLCDGTAYSRTVTYDDLYAAIGTSYGVGDGSTTFNVPDLRGRVGVGLDAANVNLAAADTLGETGGSETHTLTTGELAAHTHSIAAKSYVSDGANVAGTNETTGGGSANTGSAGSGTAHENMQPFLTVNYIIKY